MKPPALSSELTASVEADPASIAFIRYSQNAVYSFTDRRGTARILRLTLASHRSRDEIEDELAWVCELHHAGLSVCAPVRQKEGDLVVSFPGSPETFHAVVFEKASGRPLEKRDLSPKISYLHGKYLGALHTMSKRFPGKHLQRKKKWDEERYFTRDIDVYIPEKVRDSVRKVWEELRATLSSVAVTPNSYGPVHLDLGYSNFYLNGDRLELFDFDNCSLGYYACDIALALYGSLFTLLRCDVPGDRSAFAHPRTSRNLESVWGPFREGYVSENEWTDNWEEEMELWFEVAYFRSVVHAFRVQYPVTNPKIQAPLDVDLENVLARQVPIRFDFRRGKEHL